jgi:thioredoxin reductase (NADPH)
MNDQDLYDVIIIGGGPGGMAAAQYAARARMKTLVIDKNPRAGAMGKASWIENYPGIPQPIPGPELLGIMRKQAEDFGARFEKSQVQGVNFNTEPKEVITNEADFRSKTIIIATGSMGRKPTIEGEAEFLGRGISYCATCDAPFFKSMDVAAVGELGVMLDELSAISKFVNKIFVVTRTKELTEDQKKVIDGNPKLELLLSHSKWCLYVPDRSKTNS